MTTATPKLKVVSPASELDQNKAVAVDGFNAWHGEAHILRDVSVAFPRKGITCIVGPSGSGKSTLIRSINRINDEVPGFRASGEVFFEEENVYSDVSDVTKLRAEVGMVFQKPCVFPKSIAENVLFGVAKTRKLTPQDRLEIVEDNLRAVSLWKEVSHRLKDSANSLSLGQQQRLCIARTLAMKPKILLLDEPTASVDPVSGRAIEDLLKELKREYTILLVTHDLQQTKRIADHVVFICEGEVIEQGDATKMFSEPDHEKTKTYLLDSYCDC